MSASESLSISNEELRIPKSGALDSKSGKLEGKPFCLSVGKEIHLIHENSSPMISQNAKNFKSMTGLIYSLHISEFMGHCQSVFWWPNSKPHGPGTGVGTWLLLTNTMCQPWIYYLVWKIKEAKWLFVWTQEDQEWSFQMRLLEEGEVRTLNSPWWASVLKWPSCPGDHALPCCSLLLLIFLCPQRCSLLISWEAKEVSENHVLAWPHPLHPLGYRNTNSLQRLS